MFNKLTVILALSLAGCQSAGETPQQTSLDTPFSSTATAKAKDLAMQSPIATIEIGPNSTKDGVSASALARITGKLQLQDNCLVVVSSDGRALQPVFGRNTVEWDSASQQLNYNRRTYRMGDAIVLGGGGVSLKRDALPDNWAVPQCRDAEMFAVSG